MAIHEPRSARSSPSLQLQCVLGHLESLSLSPDAQLLAGAIPMPPGILATLVYLQLCPEAQGSRPHFPMASNEKQKPRLQTLQKKEQKVEITIREERTEDKSCDPEHLKTEKEWNCHDERGPG